MKVVRLSAAERYEPERDWCRISLCAEREVSIEHFVKPPGHASPRHDHPNAQVLVVLQGALVIRTDGEGEVALKEGDAVFIPGGQPHVVMNPLDRPSAGIDVFVPGRGFDFWKKRAAAQSAS